MSKDLQKNKRPLLIGITGGIGAGKSLISRIFSVLGVPVFNADIQARNILSADSEVRQKVIAVFGDEAYSNGEPDRPFLANKVFENEKLREKLNGIVHPAVGEAFAKWVERFHNQPYVLKEAAIIFETGLYEELDATILVTAPEELRIARVIKRDGGTAAMVHQRMSTQWTDAKKRPLSDFSIENDGRSPVIPRVLEIHQTLCRKASEKSNYI